MTFAGFFLSPVSSYSIRMERHRTKQGVYFTQGKVMKCARMIISRFRELEATIAWRLPGQLYSCREYLQYILSSFAFP